MIKKEKKVQIALGTYLPSIWKERKKLRDKGCKLITEGDKLIDEGYKLKAKGSNNLTVKGDKLREEGYKILAEGNLLYVNAVIEVYGQDAKISIDWNTGEFNKSK